ncbi:1, 4-beta cellobiohydrolase, partial [Blyttiomyces helicus]
MLFTSTIIGALLSCALPSSARPAATAAITSNPYVGAVGYVDPEYVTNVNTSILLDPSITAHAQVVQTVSTAIWIDTIARLPLVASNLQAAAKIATAANPVVIQFVVYDLPGRDCHALASHGEIPVGGINTYKTQYIDVFATNLKGNIGPNVRVVLIIEPDSLPNLATNLATPACAASEEGYYEGVSYALSQLSMRGEWMYIDIGH